MTLVVYRPYGNTGLRVSALGFGAMRLPKDEDAAVAVMTHAFDLGVNFLDTAPVYGDSELRCAKALKGRRQSIILSTKNPCWQDQTPDGWRKRLETSLERLDTDYIDIYKIVHDLHWDFFREHLAPRGKILDAAKKARDEGLIRHLAFSCHDSPEGLMKLIDTGEFEGMLVQYNLLDRGNEAAIARAAERGMGVAVMGPVGGGRLAGLSPELAKMVPGGVASNPEAAFRFVLGHHGVSVAVSGMNTIEMVEQNVAICSREDPMSDAERERMNAALDEAERFAQLYCTACGYCMPCPHGVDIPANFRLMNYHRVYGLTDLARHAYNRRPRTREAGDDSAKLYAGACTECGECEPKCPQRIPIIKQLAETHAALGDD